MSNLFEHCRTGVSSTKSKIRKIEGKSKLVCILPGGSIQGASRIWRISRESTHEARAEYAFFRPNNWFLNKFTHESKKDIHERDKDHLKDAYNAACDVAKKYNWYEIKCVKDGEIRSIEDIHEEIYNEIKKHKKTNKESCRLAKKRK